MHRSGDFCGEEISEDILPLAHSAGLCNRVTYDPSVHGPNIEAAPGDTIWYWGKQDVPQETTPLFGFPLTQALVEVLALAETTMEAYATAADLEQWHTQVEDLINTAYPSRLLFCETAPPVSALPPVEPSAGVGIFLCSPETIPVAAEPVSSHAVSSPAANPTTRPTAFPQDDTPADTADIPPRL